MSLSSGALYPQNLYDEQIYEPFKGLRISARDVAVMASSTTKWHAVLVWMVRGFLTSNLNLYTSILQPESSVANGRRGANFLMSDPSLPSHCSSVLYMSSWL